MADQKNEDAMDFTDVKKLAVRGISALLVLQIITEVISKLRTFLVVPFLISDDYGLRSLALFVFTFAGLPLWGWGMHIITEEKDLEEMYAVQTVFIILFWSVTGFIIFLFRNAIASLFKAPSLSSILVFYALINIFHGTAAGSKLKLSKMIQYESIAKINIITNIISLITTIYLAYAGFGVWSLILGTQLGKACWTIMNIKLAGMPLKRFKMHHFKRYFRHGASFNILAVCVTILFNIDDGIVGYLSGVDQLGFYTVAFGIGLMLSQFVVGPFRTVLFPAFSNISLKKRIRTFSRSLELIAIMLSALSLMAFFFLEIIITVLFGEEWLLLSEWGRWFVIFGLIQGLVSTMNSFLMTVQRVPDMIKVRFGQFVILFAIGIPMTYIYGPIGMIVAQTVHVFFAFILEARITALETGSDTLLKSFYAPFVSLSAAIGAAILLQLVFHPSIVALGLVSIAIYTIAIMLVGRNTVLTAWKIFQEAIGFET